jgi:hypothetical protein
MKKLLLLKHIEMNFIMAMYFKNEEQAYDWWSNFSAASEWVIIHEGERRKSGHRYGLVYSNLDEQGKLYSKHIICFSKKEAAILEQKIKKENPNYITTIQKLY